MVVDLQDDHDQAESGHVSSALKRCMLYVPGIYEILPPPCAHGLRGSNFGECDCIVVCGLRFDQVDLGIFGF